MATPSQATPSMASNLSTTSENTGPPDEAPPSQNLGQGRSGISDTISDTESFVEVSESDVKDAEAMVKSPSFHSEPGSDTLTTVSLTSEASKLEESTKNSNGSIGQKHEEKEERSRRYVAEFLEKYVLDSRTDKQVKVYFFYYFFSFKLFFVNVCIQLSGKSSNCFQDKDYDPYLHIPTSWNHI